MHGVRFVVSWKHSVCGTKADVLVRYGGQLLASHEYSPFNYREFSSSLPGHS